MSIPAAGAAQPWYRHPWPWILMAGPAAVIVAGSVTVWLAIQSADGLVADDYYRQGVTINRTLARAERARALGLEARLLVREGDVEVRLAGRVASGFPPRVRLALAHPTKAGRDQVLHLHGMDGIYAGPLAALAPGHWQVVIEDEAGTWRLTGAAILAAGSEVTIKPPAGGEQ
jgi:hypothetical protein